MALNQSRAVDVAALKQAQGILNTLYAAAASASGQGVISVTIDGQQTTWASPGQLNQSILFWEKKVAFLSNRRKRTQSIYLGY